MASVHIPVHDSSVTQDYFEDPFDEDLDLTFPPMRYHPMLYARPTQQGNKNRLRRESSRERERLYRELVGHEPYKLPKQQAVNREDVFWVTLDVKHYKPEEITLKVEGQTLLVTGKHYYETENGHDSSDFLRKYNIPETIDTHTLTSNITQDGVLCVKATKKLPLGTMGEGTKTTPKENFVLSLDVSGYRPGEISIRVHERNLIIHGETKDEDASHHGQTVHHRQFTRHFSLPSDVDIESLSSRYTKDCKITIEAPRKSSNQMRTLEIKQD